MASMREITSFTAAISLKADRRVRTRLCLVVELPFREFKSQLSSIFIKKHPLKGVFFYKWRKGGDSNSRRGRPLDGFQDRCIKPLCHLSSYATIYKTKMVPTERLELPTH